MDQRKIRGILDSYVAPLPDGIEVKVQKYMDLLDAWGRKMPLTSIRDEEQVVRFHFGESLFALSLAEMDNGRLADVGTGAGFPGLALKLARPQVSVILIERNAKKCAFLHEVTRSLKLTRVEIISREFRSAKIAPNSLEFVTSRALGEDASLLRWAEDELIGDGSVLLWVGEAECDHLRVDRRWRWSDPELIPGTRGRFILKAAKAM